MIEPGQTLLHYRIVDKIGEGGMGVVWKAEDTSLGREVAIKVLPATWSGEAERLQRFEREARLLASLNHPNIATVHGLHEEGEIRFIAMEWVPGEDLATRIERGPLELEQALESARRIAQGLEAAHAAGVVHRDLKPANIRMTPDGKIKVLDFGLAKGAMQETSGGDPELSPTLTSAGTQAGMVLGTAAYMSPEQAKGRPVDKRADVWAFGVVLYEMLTGSGAFRGDSIADTMASVLKVEPDFDRLPAETPSAVRRLLRRCLQKDPDRRLHDIADARIEIEEADLDAAEPVAAPDAVGGATARRGFPALALLGVAILGLAAGVLLGAVLVKEDTTSSGASASHPVRRAVIPIPEGNPLHWSNSLALSPDGSTLVIAADLLGGTSLFLRRLDSFEWKELPGTDGATDPFFSPDGEEIGFFESGEIKKISLRGGGRDVTVLCDAPVGTGATWDDSGWIYFRFGESRLARVREEGGAPEKLGKIGDVYHVRALPGGRGILLTTDSPDTPSHRKDAARIEVLMPDAETVKTVFDGGYSARYLSSGHLVFMRGSGLFAVPFDLDTLEASPPAISVLPGVRTDSIWGQVHYDVSPGGTLVYVPGGDFARTVPTWIDLQTGEEEPLPIPAEVYNTFDLSRDGTKLAIQHGGGSQDQIYVFDIARETFTRLTLEGSSSYPIWSHDGREVFFASTREGECRIFRQPVDGSGPAVRVMTDEQEAMLETGFLMPKSLTPDGEYLIIEAWGHATRGGDIWKLRLDGASDPEIVLATDANEIIPQISPNGKWMVFLSAQSGPYKVVARPFPDVDRREWEISGAPGYDARWSPTGDAVLYRHDWGQLLRVPVGTGDDLNPGTPTVLLETDFHDSAGSSLAVSPDGKRVLVNKPVGVSVKDETPIALVTGWDRELARLVPGR